MVARNFEFETFEKGIDCVALLLNYITGTIVYVCSIFLRTIVYYSIVQVGREIPSMEISALNYVVNPY